MANRQYKDVEARSRHSFQKINRFTGVAHEASNVVIDATRPDYISALTDRIMRNDLQQEANDRKLNKSKSAVVIHEGITPAASLSNHNSRYKHLALRGGTGRRKKKSNTRKQEEVYMETLAPGQILDYLTKRTHFSMQEILNLQKMFALITESSSQRGYMNRPIFREFFRKTFDITDDVMLDQMFHYSDADLEGSISFTEWIQVLSVFLRGTLDEQIKYCFNIYDLDFDGTIQRKEVMTLVYDCLADTLHTNDDTEIHEQVREIADMLMKKLDVCNTGYIKEQHFRDAIHRDTSLLQSLGKCLPDEEKLVTFLSFFTEDFKYFETNYCLETLTKAGYQYDTNVFEYTKPALSNKFNSNGSKEKHTNVIFQRRDKSPGGAIVPADQLKLSLRRKRQ